MAYDPQWQTVYVPFVAGIETKAAAASVPVDRLAVLENGVFTKTGSVRKRAGYEAVNSYTASGVLSGTARGLFSHSDGVCLATAKKLYSQDEDRCWSERGAYLAATYTAREVAYANKSQSAADVAVANGVEVVVWKYATNSLYFQCFDAETGVALSAITALATSTANHPSAVAVGSTILLCYTNTSTDAVMARLIQTSTLQASVATADIVTLAADLHASDNYWAITAGHSCAYLAWKTDGAGALGAGLAVAEISQAGAQVRSALVTSDNPTCPPGIAYDADAGEVLVAWTLASYRGYRRYNEADLAPVAVATEVSTVEADRVACMPSVACFEDESSSNSTVGLTVVGGSTTTVRHAHLASHGFTLSEQAVIVLGHDSVSGAQNAYYLYTSAGECVGVFESATALDRPSGHELPHYSNGHLALGFKRRISFEDRIPQYAQAGIRLHKFDDAGTVSSAEYGQSAYLSGLQLWQFDGTRSAEAGFHMAPDVRDADLAASDSNGANLLTGVQYNYRFYYEWFNARGERVRSQFMQRSITPTFASGEGKVVITIPTLRHTLKSVTHGHAAEVSIVVYRDVGDGEALEMWRVSDPDPTATGDNGYVANTFGADTVTFTDNMADASLTAEKDWASYSDLVRAPVPGPAVVAAGADRLFIAGGGVARGRVLPSLTYVPEDAAGFATELEIQVCPDVITGIATLNEAAVAFTRAQIYALPGPGFANDGSGAPMQPERVTTDVGCTTTASIVEIPAGLLFMSAKGVYGLSQDFQVEYVGAPVERFNAQTITGAHVIPDTNQVVFVCTDGDALMFDYLYSQWGAFTQHRGTGAVVFGTSYAYLRNNGDVWIRTPDGYTDNGSPITIRVRTGKFRPEGLQGFFKFRSVTVLGEYKSSHQLRVRLFFDREQSHTMERVFDVDDVLTPDAFGDAEPFGDEDWFGGSDGVTDYEFQVLGGKRMKCSQVAFEFSDIISDDAGASFELTELAIEFSVERGPKRMPARRKA